MTPYNAPQPPPQNSDGPAIWPLVVADLDFMHEHRAGLRASVMADMAERHEDGCRRYGVPLVANNGRDHAIDAYQEALDGAVFWRAEYEQTGSPGAHTLYWDAMRHVWNCRAYLLARDGR